MLIITTLKNLFNSTILEEGSSETIEIMYNDEDMMTVPEYKRLANTKCKLSFTAFPASESAFLIGMHLGSLLIDTEPVYYVTDNEDLLKNPVFENGKASIRFVRTIDEIFKKATEKKTTRKQRKPRTPKTSKAAIPKQTTDEVATINKVSISEAENMPDDDYQTPAKKMISQKHTQGTYTGDPDTIFSEKLKEIMPGMEKAATSIKDAFYNSKKPEELEYMLPMVMEKKFVDKWQKVLQEYFDDLKTTMKAMKRYSPSDEIFRG